jgi:hypothetical protein
VKWWLLMHLLSVSEYNAEQVARQLLLSLQAEGEDFALRSPERLWALVNFKSGPTHLGVTDAVIRMNYTTVPRTWVPVNEWKRHLSVGGSWPNWHAMHLLLLMCGLGYNISLHFSKK